LPSDKPLVRLEDILENIDLIKNYTGDHDFQTFARDRQCRDAVERCLQRISEAARKLEGLVDRIAPNQPWSAIRAFGNVLRHEYDSVSPVLVWQVVSEDLPLLVPSIQAAIMRLQLDDNGKDQEGP
jgi:uncharacterized protein with HEPN domain